ncbi:hypothetical protein HLB35_15445 [Halomonas sp. TBZ9]|uniref:Uncharacterized protein n=1 Tax=Vreelandella azerica TaxID=2732867 RepID=A0A7Y3TZY7_9GAMM|nr:hypothetical protein [Halomonas azerica]NOG32800.1 hypothetical protein [Halomonas azerica]
MPSIKNYPVFFMNVDSPKRDLEWRLMMAVKLAKKGAVSVVGQKEYTFPAHSQSTNAIWFGRFAANNATSDMDNELFKKVRENNTSIFFLHDEGGFYIKETYEKAIFRIHPPHLLKNDFVKRFFCGVIFSLML